MIQLSNLTATTPETPAKMPGSGIAGDAFAKVFAGELAGETATGGKSLPVGSEILPVDLPLQAEAKANTAPDATAIKLPMAAKALALAPAIAPLDDALPASDTPDGEAENAVTDGRTAAPVKAVPIDLKAKVRTDHVFAREDIAPEEGTQQPADDAQEAVIPDAEPAKSGVSQPKAAPAKADEGAPDGGQPDEPAVIDVLPGAQPLPLVAMQVMVSARPVEAADGSDGSDALASGRQAAQPVASDTRQGEAAQNDAPQRAAKQGDVTSPMLRQMETAPDRLSGSDQAAATGDKAAQAAVRDIARKDTAGRPQTGAPEFRFELTRDGGDARPRDFGDTGQDRPRPGQGGLAGQARMQIAAAPHISLPEQGPLHGQVADGAMSQAAVNPASASASSAQPLRPHEFTALVDRLVEARETARAGSVNVAVMHADFGEVSLRFNHDANGLSVSMSNNDPDFARAVGAATHTDASQNGDATGQGARRDDGGQNAGSFARGAPSGGGNHASGEANAGGGGRQQPQHDPRSERASSQQRPPVKDQRADADGIYA